MRRKIRFILARLTRGLFRGELISQDRHVYKILFDDPNIGLVNVNDYDVMVGRKRKTLTRNVYYYSSFQSEEPLEHLVLVEKLKTIKFGEQIPVKKTLNFSMTVN